MRNSLLEKFKRAVRAIPRYVFAIERYRANLRSRRMRAMLNMCCPADHRTAREFRVISIPRRRSPVNSGLLLPSARGRGDNSRGDKIRRVDVNCVV